ncbi:MAG: DUF3750 domain-containing protein [Proteobacteria bacterium]|nr:DUF3750 domain-containing protein [Pseudomonadota bacterium]
MLELSGSEDELFVLSSPLPKPLHKIAVHTWLVTNSAGQTPDRWEVWQMKRRSKISWGHVHKNLFSVETGMPVSLKPGSGSIRWNSCVVGRVEGEIASKMIQYLNTFAPQYIFSERYFPWPGPNSNTFVQWVLDQFKEADLKLPISALGARFSSLIPYQKRKV